MDHYAELKRDLEKEPAPEASAFPVPASLVLVAIKYALRKAWSTDDRDKIKEAVLKIYDEVVVPADLPVVDGALETAVERIVRTLLSTLLDAALG